MIGDVRVLGLVSPTTVLDDIGMDVPLGVVVEIPGARAHISRDLWRALSQRCIFQLQDGPAVTSNGSQMLENPELKALREQVRTLTAENARLREAPPPDAAQSKLDDILALLRQGSPVPGQIPSTQVLPAQASTSEVVSGEVPTFIPSQIKPEGFQVQVQTKSEESPGTGVTSAAQALRKLRRGNG